MVEAVSEPLISIRDVTFDYGEVKQALRGVGLDIYANDIFVIFGPSHSGKTTLLRLLNRLSDLVPDAKYSGTILFEGRDIFAPEVDVTVLRRQICMVFATPTPLPGTIYENMSYGLKMAGIRDKKIIEERTERALRQSALWDEVKDRLDKSAFALSGGQKQRLCIARSLALEPTVILLDNPTSGLDPISTSIVEESLIEIKKRYTIVMVPHSVQQAARIADCSAFMLDGEVIEVDYSSELFVNPSDSRTEDYITGRFG